MTTQRFVATAAAIALAGVLAACDRTQTPTPTAAVPQQGTGTAGSVPPNQVIVSSQTSEVPSDARGQATSDPVVPPNPNTSMEASSVPSPGAAERAATDGAPRTARTPG